MRAPGAQLGWSASAACSFGMKPGAPHAAVSGSSADLTHSIAVPRTRHVVMAVRQLQAANVCRCVSGRGRAVRLGTAVGPSAGVPRIHLRRLRLDRLADHRHLGLQRQLSARAPRRHHLAQHTRRLCRLHGRRRRHWGVHLHRQNHFHRALLQCGAHTKHVFPPKKKKARRSDTRPTANVPTCPPPHKPLNGLKARSPPALVTLHFAATPAHGRSRTCTTCLGVVRLGRRRRRLARQQQHRPALARSQVTASTRSRLSSPTALNAHRCPLPLVAFGQPAAAATPAFGGFGAAAAPAVQPTAAFGFGAAPAFGASTSTQGPPVARCRDPRSFCLWVQQRRGSVANPRLDWAALAALALPSPSRPHLACPPQRPPRRSEVLDTSAPGCPPREHYDLILVCTQEAALVARVRLVGLVPVGLAHPRQR
jgi:hypothetical protein